MMKMVLRCLIALLVFWQVAPACAGLMTLLGVGHPGGQQFFVASTGNNANPGTQASPWLDLTNVNSHTFGANDCVNLNGGNTFGGGTTGISSTTLHCVTSYGTGQATISTGNSASCLTNTNIPSWSYTNFICSGGGNTSNATQGILVQNTTGAQIPGGTISGVTVSGYGQDCILLSGTNNFGFNNFAITGNTVHDCTGKAGVLTAGINVNAVPSPLATVAVHTNGTISGNAVFNLNGYAGALNWTGSGIWCESCTAVVIASNDVHDTGLNSNSSSGPVCITTNFSDNITIQYNEAYNCLTGNGVDGDAIDLDGDITNSVVQYNYTHDSASYCLFGFNYNSGTWANNTFRFNIAANCGLGQINIQGLGGTITSASVYNNTTYGPNAVVSSGPVTAQFSNNIFYELGTTSNIIIVPSPSSQTFTGNNYYGNGSYSWNGTAYPTFAAWQTASGQEKIGATNVGKNVEPRLVVYGFHGAIGGYVPTSLNQYQLQTGSPMLGGGIDITAQYSINIGPTDFYGNAILSSSKVIGAGQQVPWTGASSASCSQATTLIGRLTSPATSEQQAANALVCGGIVDGWWALQDIFYKLAGSSSTNALLNWMSTSFTATATSAPAFAANVGYTGNGTSSWINTNYNPSTAGGNSTVNSTEIDIYITAAGTRSGISGPMEMGVFDATNVSWICLACTFNSGTFNSFVNSTDTTPMLLATAQITGMWIASRTGATSAGNASYLNGVPLTLTIPGDSSTALPNNTIGIFSGNSAPCCFSPDRASYASAGGGLTATLAMLKAYRMNADAIPLGINAF